MASIEPVRQKVARAYKHLKSYEAEAIRYFSEQPGEVVTDADSDPQGRIIVRFKERIPVPHDIPIIIGDALQNLRSALDYLVWELVLAAKNQPTEKNMFPICDSSDSFDEQCRRHRLDGVSPDAIAEIKGLQPYHYGDKCSKAPIRVLEDFCNINKHRRVLLTVLAVHMSQTTFKSSVSGDSLQSILSPREHNAELAVSPIPSAIGETMEVEGGAAFFITFNEGVAKGKEVAAVLNHLWHFVDKFAVPKFERFFP